MLFCLLCPAAALRAQDETRPAAIKRNARPAVEDHATEPFDRATAAEMSQRCVTLDTEAGEIEIEMLAEAAPATARNFLNLVATGFYDETAFSRVVRDFIIQGGNLATREGRITPELIRRSRRSVPDEPNAIKHTRGVVSMARTDEPDSATTHFFILVGDGPHLDGKFAAFGRVTRGIETADAINRMPIENEKPKQPVRLRKATVAPCAAQIQNPTAATPKPDAVMDTEPS